MQGGNNFVHDVVGLASERKKSKQNGDQGGFPKHKPAFRSGSPGLCVCSSSGAAGQPPRQSYSKISYLGLFALLLVAEQTAQRIPQAFRICRIERILERSTYSGAEHRIRRSASDEKGKAVSLAGKGRQATGYTGSSVSQLERHLEVQRIVRADHAIPRKLSDGGHIEEDVVPSNALGCNAHSAVEGRSTLIAT